MTNVADIYLAYENKTPLSCFRWKTDIELLFVKIHCWIKARGTQDNPEAGTNFQLLYATQVKANTNNFVNLQVQKSRPAGPAASAEPSPQVSGRD